MTPPASPTRGFRPYAIAFLVAAADQLCKSLVRAAFAPGEGVDLAGTSLRFTHVQNPGGAFGIFRDSAIPFAALAAIAAAVLIVVIGRLPAAKVWERTALALILGGATGNLVDRLRFGRVIDFIDVGWHQLRWPVFNLADMAVVTGVGLFLFLSLRKSGGGSDDGAVEPR